MSPKELQYIEDALGHEQFLTSQCQQAVSQLTDAERRAIDAFIAKLDVTNNDHVLLFGSEAQRKVAAFSDSALAAVRTILAE